jgi:hypothetical protein
MTAIFSLPRAHPVVADTVLANGKVVPRTLPGARLHFYLADTTTPVDTYTSSSRLTKHTWPVVADATGKFPAIYLGAGIVMDAVLKASDDSLIDTYEDIPGDAVDGGDSILSLGRGLEVGAIVFYSLPDEPAGWKRIKKDPQALAKASYPELNAKYAAQGYPYGSASTTFNIPGGAGLFPRIWDPSTTHDPDAGGRVDHATGLSTTGNIIGSRQASANKAHDHAGTTSTVAAVPMTVRVRSVAAGGGALRTIYDTSEGLASDFPGSVSNVPAHNHTISSAGGTEARPDNVAFPLLILVNPGAAAAATSAPLGMAYSWSADTSATAPAAGTAKGNAADIADVTVLRLAKADVHGADLSEVWEAVNAIPGTRKATLHIRNAGALANGITAVIAGEAVVFANHVEVPIDAIAASGTFTEGVALSVQLAFGALPGDTGPAGPNSGLDYRWDTGTTDADPGGGNLRVDNATLGSATFLYISKTGRNAEALGALIGEWGASTNPANKGHVRILAVANRAKFVEAAVTGACVDGTTYWKVPIAVVASGTAFAANDPLCVTHARAGDTVTLPAVTRQVITASGTWTKPANCRAIRYRGCGGGGSGGSVSGVASQVGAASGGAAGGEFEGWLDVTAIASIAVTIGAGGAASAAGANNGNAGGNTVFGAHATGNGGPGGIAQAAGTALGVTAPAAGGTATGSDNPVTGAPSGGGIRLSGTVGRSGSGASGSFGTGGAGRTTAGAGNASSGYGSGGGGALSTAAVAQPGGAGAPGVVFVEEHY